MHILFITDNFYPESNAPAIRTYQHCKYWASKGHKITVITSAPNFPEGVVYDGYKNTLRQKEMIDGIEVWRVKTFIAQNKGNIFRTIDYLSFMISSLFFGLFVKKPDIVVGTSPQFFTIISAWLLAKIKKRKFVFELRDLWPSSIVAVGAMNDNFVIKFLSKIENFLYKQADLIVPVTKSFKKVLVERGISKDKIQVVYNGTDTESFKPSKQKDPALLEELNLIDSFVFGYIGTHGMAHGLENIINAAEKLKNYSDIKVILIGDGAEKQNLMLLAKMKNLDNVIFISKKNHSEIKKYLRLCDISIVHLKNEDEFRNVIPSKIFESASMAIPILISVPKGEATSMIESNQCGITCKPMSSKHLAEAMLQLKNNKPNTEFSKNCIEFSKKFERKNLAQEMLDHLIKISGT